MELQELVTWLRDVFGVVRGWNTRSAPYNRVLYFENWSNHLHCTCVVADIDEKNGVLSNTRSKVCIRQLLSALSLGVLL